MKIKTFMKLPLSERLQRSLDDLIYCEKNPKYRIDMKIYFRKEREDGKKFCTVCHAGACLARSINGSLTSQITEDHRVLPVNGAYPSGVMGAWGSHWFNIGDGFGDFMEGVNALRTGNWAEAADYLNLRPMFFRGIGIRKDKMPMYEAAPGKYKKAFRHIIRFVKKKEKEYAKKGKSMYRTTANNV